MINSGIYQILNRAADMIYVGSAINLTRRWLEHKRKLNNNSHVNKYLQNAWNKYGEESFEFIVLQYVENKSQLLKVEQNWLDWLKPYDKGFGYNLQLTAGSNLGRVFDDEHKNKISLKLKGRIFSDETKAKISAAKTGVKRASFSKEHREKLSATSKGRKANLGKKASQETRNKISLSLLGNKRALKSTLRLS